MIKKSIRRRLKAHSATAERTQYASPPSRGVIAEVEKSKSLVWIFVDVLSVATLLGWLLWVYTMKQMKLTPLPAWLQFLVAGAFGIAIAIHNYVLPKLVLSGEYQEDRRGASFVNHADRFASAM